MRSGIPPRPLPPQHMNQPTLARTAEPTTSLDLGAVLRILALTCLPLLNIVITVYLFSYRISPHPSKTGVVMMIAAVFTGLALYMHDITKFKRWSAREFIVRLCYRLGVIAALLILVFAFSRVKPPHPSSAKVQFLNGIAVSEAVFAKPADRVRLITRQYEINARTRATTSDKIEVEITLSSAVCIDPEQGAAPHAHRTLNDEHEVSQAFATTISTTASDVLRTQTFDSLVRGMLVDAKIKDEVMLPQGYRWETDLAITEVKVIRK